MHKRRLAGAIVTDQTQTLAGADRKVDADESVHRTKAFRHTI
jgi:hypothetical protein